MAFAGKLYSSLTRIQKIMSPMSAFYSDSFVIIFNAYVRRRLLLPCRILLHYRVNAACSTTAQNIVAMPCAARFRAATAHTVYPVRNLLPPLFLQFAN